jgi:hypothetical protein
MTYLQICIKIPNKLAFVWFIGNGYKKEASWTIFTPVIKSYVQCDNSFG